MMSTSTGYLSPPEGVTSSIFVPTVSTMQPVRSPVWAVPSMPEGHPNMGGDTVIPVPDISSHAPAVGGVLRKVVVKPLSSNPQAQVVSPTKAAQLTQLMSQLTPQQAQSLLKTLQSQQVATPTVTPLPGQTAGATPSYVSTQPVQVPRVPSGSKPLIPPPRLCVNPASAGYVSTQPVQVPRVPTGSKPLMPRQKNRLQRHGVVYRGTPILPASGIGPGLQVAGSQRIVAPVTIPPADHIPQSNVTSTDSFHSLTPVAMDTKVSSGPQQVVTTSKPRKPCNCKNSQCLKLYCDCFANGEFCRDACHCQSCKNNVHNTDERARAVKTCLDRNPHAFKPKVGHNKVGDERRHIKGCNCKRSGCLKNYCECFEAKIPCSNLCRCVGCKNLADKPESKSLMQLADAADFRTQQQRAATSHFLEQLDHTSSRPQPTTQDGQRLPFSFINKEVAKATCLCLLEEASHAEMNGKSPVEVERVVLEEFGRCMTQIITSAQAASEDSSPQRHMTVH